MTSMHTKLEVNPSSFSSDHNIAMSSSYKITNMANDTSILLEEGTTALEVGSAASEDDDQFAQQSMDNTSTSHSSAAQGTPEIAVEESRKVFRARVVVITILIAVATTISTSVFFFTRKAEENEFDAQWQGNSLQILRSFKEIVQEKLSAISILPVAFTAYARANNHTWPFVTMNDFQQQAAIPLRVSNALYTHLMPIVSLEKREKWEEFSIQNKGWIEESRERLQAIGLEEAIEQDSSPFAPAIEGSTLDFSSGIANKIYTADEETFQPIPSKVQQTYYPIWQQSPSYPIFINSNFVEISDVGPFIKVVAATGEIVIGGCDVQPPGNLSSPNPFTRVYSFLLSYAAGERVDYRGDPLTSILFPVFDSFFGSRKQVAVMYALIDWKAYFFNVLPKNVESIIIILANSCQGPFTYVVDGPDVTFVGAGDFHSSSMEQYAQHVNLQDLLTDSINGVRLNQDVCQYNLTVYPTEQFYNQYNTSESFS